MEFPERSGRSTHRRNVLTDEDQFGGDDAADAGEKIGRRAIVDRHDDDAREQTAPERDDPFGTVLAPEDNLVVFSDAGRGEPRGESTRGARHFFVCVTAASKAIVVDEKLAARKSQIAEKIKQRVADHE